jgi:hypothetical protein
VILRDHPALTFYGTLNRAKYYTHEGVLDEARA